jgi:hypothetical protein
LWKCLETKITKILVTVESVPISGEKDNYYCVWKYFDKMKYAVFVYFIFWGVGKMGHVVNSLKIILLLF